MAGYVALFELLKKNNPENYGTLNGIIEPLLPGPVFSSGELIPFAVLFHWNESPKKLLERLREHIYEGDSVMLLKVSEGIAVLEQDAADEFQEFLSGL